MPKAKEKQAQEGGSAAHNRAVLQEEREKLTQARQRIASQIQDVDQAIAAGQDEEARLQEEALTKGYPAKPHMPL